MNKEKELQCLSRLIKYSSCFDDILQFLKDSKVSFENEIISRDSEKAIVLHNLLESGKVSEKLTLVSYEWSLLPKEFIKLTLISTLDQKTIMYSQP